VLTKRESVSGDLAASCCSELPDALADTATSNTSLMRETNLKKWPEEVLKGLPSAKSHDMGIA
jgi:hypothetical protein